MPWPVIPFSQITGISGRFYPIYQRWPPETLQVFLVGGGGSSPAGSGAGGGGGGGIRDQAFSTGLKPSGQASYPIAVGGAGGASSFNTTIVAAGGNNAGTGNTNLTGGASGNGNGGGTGSGRRTCTGISTAYAAGGGGGAHSGAGGAWQQIGNDYYTGPGAFGYTVSPGVANAIGQGSVGHGGQGGHFVGAGFSNWITFCTHQCRGNDNTPAGGGLGLVGNRAATNGSVYGAGGGGWGGTGAQGVVVISYAGTQASPSGTVSSFGGFTYHVFTAASATLEL